ncbi:serine/threonine protein kinase [Streptomyces sp. Tu 2975]|uniref:serine/threonine-protein kinase n=1 Tax=Streptomyces sp. Tu 2975 TaxID=2676871 RepID=UPI00135B7183|nr:serine/threonine-protein kinase [Streptomyces sp. Tu 2975]QIP84520.1 serine/threonine protein kinase [Streptomyces sp. Tu 2975]
MPPQVISERYELVEELSHGGMGDVWRGYDTVLDRPIAVKVVRQESVTSPHLAEEFARRFRREARVTARIQHPGVPQVYDAVLDPAASYRHLYLVMELLDGVSLTNYIAPDAPLPLSWAAAVAAQVCTVLSHAHEVPVIHRDLKPSNILVARDGTVKVLDFGIAALLRTDVTKITSTGSPVGTTAYMSPEQVQGGRITPQSDLYALGCVLHELLCGRPVFDGTVPFLLMRQHVEDEPVPLTELREEVPSALEALVLHLLRKRPEHRPADTQEVYERLLPFLPAPGDTSVPHASGPADAPDPTGVFRRPYAPLPRPGIRPAGLQPTVVDPGARHAALLPDDVRAAIKDALLHVKALFEEERFAQAVEVLGETIDEVAPVLGAENGHVLGLRQRRAAGRLLNGDFRQALPEFDALADAYARTGGPTSEQARGCRAQAAHCRAELGQVTVALRELQDVLAVVRTVESDASEEAIDLRRSVGLLLLSEGRAADARQMLLPLHEDLLVLYGPDDEDTVEIADALTRIRLALGGPDAAPRAHRKD